MEKQCSKCKKTKPLSDFHKSKQCKDGYKTECKSCRSIYAKKKRVADGGTNYIDRTNETESLKICTKCKCLKNRDEFKHSSWCLECRRKYTREKFNYKPKFIPIITDTQKQCCKCKNMVDFCDFSPSKRGRLGLSAYCKKCNSKMQLQRLTKEERRIKTQKYRDENREWWRSLHRINQFNRRNKIKLVSDGTVTPDFVKEVYNQTTCYYCKEEIPKKYRTLEHKLPLDRGGKHSAENIVMSCLSCNCSKGKMTEEEFYNYNN